METLRTVFLSGLKVVIPLLATFILLYWVLVGIEIFFQKALLLVQPYYFPGLGILVAVIVIFFIGLMMQIQIAQKGIKKLQSYFLRLPIIHTIYNTATDVTSLFTKKQIQADKVVFLKTPIGKLIGIITQDQLNQKLNKSDKDEIAVYIQMSYNLGGYTFIVSKDSIEPLNISVKEAMALTISACVSKIREQS